MAEEQQPNGSPRRREPGPSTSVPRLIGGPVASGARREFERRVLRATVIVNVVVLCTIVLALLAWRLRVVLLLVFVSIFIAALIHPIVSFVERRRLRRSVATTVVSVSIFVLFGLLGAFLVHPVVGSATHFVEELPKLVRQAEHGKGQIGHLVRRLHLLHFVQSRQSHLRGIVGKLAKPALAVGKTVVSGVVALVTVIFLSFFILIEAPRLVNDLLGWMQGERAARLRGVLDDVGRAIAGYMLGNFATSVIAGVVIGVTLYLVGVPFPAVLAVWVALVDFLPLIGGLLAGVPTVIIALLHSLTAAVVVLVVFLVYQEFENHVLNPLIMSRTVRLNPLWVLLAVVFGAAVGDLVGFFGGLVGALLAVPAAGALQVIVRDLLSHKTGAAVLKPEAHGTGPVPIVVSGGPTGAGDEA